MNNLNSKVRFNTMTQESEFNFPDWFREPNRTTLNLFVGGDPVECRQMVLKSRFALPHHLHERDQARLQELNEAAYDTAVLELDRARALAHALPRLTKLRIILHRVLVTPTVDSIIHLLHQWGATLLELDIYSDYVLDRDHVSQAELYAAINERLPILQGLTLELVDGNITRRPSTRIRLSILDRLKRVHLFFSDALTVMFIVLGDLTLDGIQDLRIASPIREEFEWSLFDHWTLMAHLTQAHIVYNPYVWWFQPPSLASLCSYKPRLTTLVLSVCQSRVVPFTLQELVQGLQKLPQLRHLQLNFVELSGMNNAQDILHHVTPEPSSDTCALTLPNVRQLHLRLTLRKHEDIQTPRHLQAAFPALELLLVEYAIARCESCHFVNGRFWSPRQSIHSQEGEVLHPVQNEAQIDRNAQTDAHERCGNALLSDAQLVHAHWLDRGIRTVFHFTWNGLERSLGRNESTLLFDSRTDN